MTNHAEMEKLVDAVRHAFVNQRGEQAEVALVELNATQHWHVAGDHAELAVILPDAALLAELVPDATVSAAMCVVGADSGVLLYTTEPVGDSQAVTTEAGRAAAGHVTGGIRELRAEASVVDALHAVGRELTAQLDLDKLVQNATDAATAATGADFGAFFYNLVDQFGESYTLYTISGVPRAAFSSFPMPRNTAVFAPTFDGIGTVRSADITQDARFGKNAPYHGMPEGHLPVCSYLAVPVTSPTTGEVLGGFFFGHPESDRFSARHEYLAEGIAGYTGIALDNARLYERERNLAAELSRSMLPTVPDVPGLRLLTRYLPAATGSKIGGDWFDVIPLQSGSTAFVIGDVVGHGITAATVMGQMRTAIRSYAVLELPPANVLRHVSQLTTGLFDTAFVTCFYAVHNSHDDTLTFANAGHLAAVLIRPDGTMEQIGEAMAQPLGIGTTYHERTTSFPPGSDLVLYTDGLVESRTRDLTLGIQWLLEGLAELRKAADSEAAWDQLIDTLTESRHDDDIAILHAHNTAIPIELTEKVEATTDHIAVFRDRISNWAAGLGLDDDRRDDLTLAVYEAMANAVEHAYRDRPVPGPLDIRGSCHDGRITVTVTDQGQWRTPDPHDTIRGRGLKLINSLTDHEVDLRHSNGTTITMVWNAPR
ncbi:SpoIIE family protein phosphatase [Amycolatopsis sp. cmx-4-54]|uniref:ATP-binding SpoIIE family protein phosphatase n=1 Tax=Amycolatopsis sp. cmx-4-54 TaxID=2790936 RepID=UPI00397DD9DF